MHIKQPVNVTLFCHSSIFCYYSYFILSNPYLLYSFIKVTVMIETMFIWNFTKYGKAGMKGRWHETWFHCYKLLLSGCF